MLYQLLRLLLVKHVHYKIAVCSFHLKFVLHRNVVSSEIIYRQIDEAIQLFFTNIRKSCHIHHHVNSLTQMFTIQSGGIRLTTFFCFNNHDMSSFDVVRVMNSSFDSVIPTKCNKCISGRCIFYFICSIQQTKSRPLPLWFWVCAYLKNMLCNTFFLSLSLFLYLPISIIFYVHI